MGNLSSIDFNPSLMYIFIILAAEQYQNMFQDLRKIALPAEV